MRNWVNHSQHDTAIRTRFCSSSLCIPGHQIAKDEEPGLDPARDTVYHVQCDIAIRTWYSSERILFPMRHCHQDWTLFKVTLSPRLDETLRQWPEDWIHVFPSSSRAVSRGCRLANSEKRETAFSPKEMSIGIETSTVRTTKPVGLNTSSFRHLESCPWGCQIGESGETWNGIFTWGTEYTPVLTWELKFFSIRFSSVHEKTRRVGSNSRNPN